MTTGSGVTVNSVLPGPTRVRRRRGFPRGYGTENNALWTQWPRTSSRTSGRPHLIQRFATVEEVANMVVYTCSKEASATNGAALRVEGGLLRSIV